MSVQHGHWGKTENVDAALLAFIERKRKKKVGGGGGSASSSSSTSSSNAVPLLFPTQAELRAAGEASVAKAVNSAGGLAAAARRLGIRPVNRARWWWRDFDSLAEELREVATAAALQERGGARAGVGGESGEEEQQQQQQLVLSMPTQVQLKAAGRGALIHAIRMQGGAEEVARRAGLRCLGRSGRQRSGGASGREELEGEEEEDVVGL